MNEFLFTLFVGVSSGCWMYSALTIYECNKKLDDIGAIVDAIEKKIGYIRELLDEFPKEKK